MVLKVDLASLQAAAEVMARLLQPDAIDGEQVIVTMVVKDGVYTLALAPFGPIIEDSIQ